MREECEFALDNLVYALQIPVHLVPGGTDRQSSVRNALEYLEELGTESSFVAIHDGARPFASMGLIIRTLATASVVGGSVPGITIHDAVKRVDERGLIEEGVERRGLAIVQTPQIFRYPEILECHKKAASSDKLYVDDSEIYIDNGYQVAICDGEVDNIKITTLKDLENGRKMV